jgi:hypothetical protein
MPNVLTTQSAVTCAHNGTVQVASTAKLKVGGNPVLLMSSVVEQQISNCPSKPPPPANVTCTHVLTVTNIPAPKLTVHGDAVLVDTITGTTDGNLSGVPNRLGATANQSKLLTA